MLPSGVVASRAGTIMSGQIWLTGSSPPLFAAACECAADWCSCHRRHPLEEPPLQAPSSCLHGCLPWPTAAAGAIQFEATLRGRGGHAAMPHLTADPGVAMRDSGRGLGKSLGECAVMTTSSGLGSIALPLASLTTLPASLTTLPASPALQLCPTRWPALLQWWRARRLWARCRRWWRARPAPLTLLWSA